MVYNVSVVDVYQEWSGPTKALHTALKKLKVDIGSDPFLHYCVVSQNNQDQFGTDT